MSVFIAGDCMFCWSEERDKKLIENWNAAVKEEDFVILLGEIMAKNSNNWDKIANIFSKLNGKKRVFGLELSDEEIEHWKEITGYLCFKSDAAVVGKVDGQDYYYVRILTSMKGVPKSLDQRKYCAAAKSLTGQKYVFDKKIMSLSIEDWDNTPIPYMEIPRMIDDMLLFEQMKD